MNWRHPRILRPVAVSGVFGAVLFIDTLEELKTDGLVLTSDNFLASVFLKLYFESNMYCTYIYYDFKLLVIIFFQTSSSLRKFLQIGLEGQSSQSL